MEPETNNHNNNDNKPEQNQSHGNNNDAYSVTAPTYIPEKGVAPIKKEFLRPRSNKRTLESVETQQQENEKKLKIEGETTEPQKDGLDQEKNSDNNNNNNTNNNAANNHNNDNQNQNQKNNQNQNKKGEGKKKKKEKNGPAKYYEETGLCGLFVSNGQCSHGDKCRYSHDLLAWYKTKPKDLPMPCANFERYGWCPSGVKCRFGSSHLLVQDGKVINVDLRTNPEKAATLEVRPEERNPVPKEVTDKLRKRKYVYPKADALIKRYNKSKQGKGGNKNEKDVDAKPADNAVPFEGIPKDVVPDWAILSDAEVKLRPEEKKKIDFRNSLYLAPLTTVGNLPFRRICKKFGADITCGEMALATNILQGHRSEWALLKRHPEETIFGVQLAGSHVDSMSRCAELLDQTIDVDFIDLNCGCPIDLITDKGMGSAMLDRVTRLQEVTRAVSSVTTVPFTVKLRIGRDEKHPTAHKNIIPYLHLWGANAVTLHGRSRQQRYTKEADWSYIHKCTELTPLPLIGNGDVYTWEEAVEHQKNNGIMVARGAIIKPWLFREIKERKYYDISATERLDIVKDFANMGLDHWGSDDRGIESTRSFLLNWLAFLHRYVPVGLYEVMPPKINQRPPPFFGRNELETQLASPDVKDWIKISEMFLGPVPSNFSFVPKHKSNSWNDEKASVEG